MSEGENSLALELLKAILKPGYFYAIGRDGNLYSAKAELPERGKTISFPPFRIKEDEDAQ